MPRGPQATPGIARRKGGCPALLERLRRALCFHLYLLVENLNRLSRGSGSRPLAKPLQAYPGKPVPASRWPLCGESPFAAVVSCCRPRFLQTGLEPLFFRRVTAGAGRFRGAAVSGGLLKGCRAGSISLPHRRLHLGAAVDGCNVSPSVIQRKSFLGPSIT